MRGPRSRDGDKRWSQEERTSQFIFSELWHRVAEKWEKPRKGTETVEPPHQIQESCRDRATSSRLRWSRDEHGDQTRPCPVGASVIGGADCHSTMSSGDGRNVSIHRRHSRVAVGGSSKSSGSQYTFRIRWNTSPSFELRPKAMLREPSPQSRLVEFHTVPGLFAPAINSVRLVRCSSCVVSAAFGGRATVSRTGGRPRAS